MEWGHNRQSLHPPGQNLMEVMEGECKINSSVSLSYVAVVSKPRILVPEHKKMILSKT